MDGWMVERTKVEKVRRNEGCMLREEEIRNKRNYEMKEKK
jgi:stalled ribosome alternative rescue factor ArfA